MFLLYFSLEKIQLNDGLLFCDIRPRKSSALAIVLIVFPFFLAKEESTNFSMFYGSPKKPSSQKSPVIMKATKTHLSETINIHYPGAGSDEIASCYQFYFRHALKRIQSDGNKFYASTPKCRVLFMVCYTGTLSMVSKPVLYHIARCPA